MKPPDKPEFTYINLAKLGPPPWFTEDALLLKNNPIFKPKIVYLNPSDITESVWFDAEKKAAFENENEEYWKGACEHFNQTGPRNCLPILILPDKKVLDGWAELQIAKKCGWTEIPCVICNTRIEASVALIWHLSDDSLPRIFPDHFRARAALLASPVDTETKQAVILWIKMNVPDSKEIKDLVGYRKDRKEIEKIQAGLRQEFEPELANGEMSVQEVDAAITERFKAKL